MSNKGDTAEALKADQFSQARLPIQLNIPDGDPALLADARKAIRKEYRAAAKWKRLRCRNAELASQTGSATIYELQIGHAVEFDWTWEGAVAFRPVLLKTFSSSQAAFIDHDVITPDIDNSILWSGEVLEVDEAAGRIFIATADPEHPPRRGSFYVRPYEFLACLDAACNEYAFQKLLPQRLAASEGAIHPDVFSFSDVGLPAFKPWWRKSWSVLWGPPGTGKTYLTGQQIARVLADPFERILVVSTTNRATDAVALSIGRAAKSTTGTDLLGEGNLLRIGKGASAKKFEQEALTDMLQGTKIECLVQIEQLVSEYAYTKEIQEKALIQQQIKHLHQIMRDAAKRNFLDASVRVVVSTAFKAMTFIELDEIKDSLQDGLAPFTTIFIDEAGLMSRLAVSTLSLFAACRVVLVGDPKQLAPISKISRILEPAQGNWLAHSGLSHLEHMDKAVDGVYALTEQYRMHPQLCNLVSAFQYNGALTTANKVRERSNPLPLLLKKQPRAIWYVLDEDTESLPAIRAERDPGNRSWVRKSTQKVLLKIFSDPKMRTANALFIAPFKAQAKSINSFLVSNNLNSWTASTVHSQQGAEADIVLFDSVNAGSYAWPYDEWKRLINVAFSRAREAVIVFASRAEMDEPYLRPLVKLLSPQVLKKKGSKLFWQKISAKTEFILP
ncbi:MAG: AAA family ATPase, partial [Candidatus Electrothrix sp. AR4]|nr:AAA family ATPase [Candidatus Electrothrix sp. AR4]